MMKSRNLCAALLAAALLLLPGCGASDGIVGNWTCTLPVSLIGIEMTQPTTLGTDMTMEFHEDGSGRWIMDTPDDKLDSDFTFAYTIEEDQLTLIYNDREHPFTITLDGDALKLESPRITYELTRQN